jgi:uncharacterized membrane protein HdeD (DUF308 family)
LLKYRLNVRANKSMSLVLGILVILVGVSLLAGGIMCLTAGLWAVGILALVLAVACGVGAYFIMRKKTPPSEVPPPPQTPPTI